MAIRIQLRRGTSAEWSSANPILAQGEFAVDLDSGKFKIGNGVTRWNELNYSGFVGQGTDPSDWNMNTNLGLYYVNRESWGGTIGTPLDTPTVGMLTVFVTGDIVVQRYQPGLAGLATAEYVRTKVGSGAWSAWNQSSSGATLDGGNFQYFVKYIINFEG